MLSERQEIFKKMRTKVGSGVQSRASERLQDQIIEEIKEMKHKKTEDALKMVRKKNDLWKVPT